MEINNKVSYYTLALIIFLFFLKSVNFKISLTIKYFIFIKNLSFSKKSKNITEDNYLEESTYQENLKDDKQVQESLPFESNSYYIFRF